LVWQALKRMTRWRGREMRVGIVAKLLEPVIRERAVFLIASDLKKFRRMVVGKAQNVIPVLFVVLAPLPTRAVAELSVIEVSDRSGEGAIESDRAARNRGFSVNFRSMKIISYFSMLPIWASP
jgi:hypothetical protein